MLTGTTKPRSYLYALAKATDSAIPKVSKSRRFCFACGDYLCKNHEDVYHEAGPADVDVAMVATNTTPV